MTTTCNKSVRRFIERETKSMRRRGVSEKAIAQIWKKAGEILGAEYSARVAVKIAKANALRKLRAPAAPR